ncbi:hypothetical protein MVES1_003623 [Malassezia vespertilionis]|uniref:uncharacterized protein n=1 Tax=Malassezia vespertilionis TaxID=2020962 RepID=UPI0024B0CEAB|nr:uncharacterized protein MVES1_003623 [Malassezia vespertilionis]WFD08251.1 hypothetical protein MVES1_003623 [Malassezia vespertilionis]
MADREPSTVSYLAPSQANALIYSTLCGFMLIGLWAGYNTRNKQEFISGVKTQAAAHAFLVKHMSSSLLQSYPELALMPQAGILGLFAYTFASVVPLWMFAIFGPLIRRLCPDGFTLSEYMRRRYGWPIGVLSALIFIGFMFCFMIVELNTYGVICTTIAPNVNRIIPPLIVAITTTIYTAYGGFKASLWTDNFNAIAVIIFIIIGGAMFGTQLDLDKTKVHEKPDNNADPLQLGILTPQKLGGELWYILPVSIIFSQMFNQGFWQRAFASKSNKGLWASVLLASLPLFAIIFLVGMAGPLSYWAHQWPPSEQGYPLISDGDEEDGSNALFYALLTMPKWVHGIVLVLAGVLSSSAYDTFQSAQISVIQNDLFLGRVNIWWCRIFLLLLNVPCVALASISIDIFKVFLVADLASVAVIPPAFLGLSWRLYMLNGFDVFVGGCGGFLTVFIFGTIFYHNAIDGGKLIGLPNDLYADDYSVLGAFFAAPLGALGFALASCIVRILCTYLFCRATGRAFTALEYREYDLRHCVLPQDRPAGLHGIHGSGNPDDGRRLDPEAKEVNDGFDSKLHATHRIQWLPAFLGGGLGLHDSASDMEQDFGHDEKKECPDMDTPLAAESVSHVYSDMPLEMQHETHSFPVT